MSIPFHSSWEKNKHIQWVIDGIAAKTQCRARHWKKSGDKFAFCWACGKNVFSVPCVHWTSSQLLLNSTRGHIWAIIPTVFTKDVCKHLQTKFSFMLLVHCHHWVSIAALNEQFSLSASTPSCKIPKEMRRRHCTDLISVSLPSWNSWHEQMLDNLRHSCLVWNGSCAFCRWWYLHNKDSLMMYFCWYYVPHWSIPGCKCKNIYCTRLKLLSLPTWNLGNSKTAPSELMKWKEWSQNSETITILSALSGNYDGRKAQHLTQLDFCLYVNIYDLSARCSKHRSQATE